MAERLKRVTVNEQGKVIGSSEAPDHVWSGLKTEDQEGNILKTYRPYKKELDPSR